MAGSQTRDDSISSESAADKNMPASFAGDYSGVERIPVSLSLSLSIYLSLSLSRSLSRARTHTHTLSLSLSLSISHTLSLSGDYSGISRIQAAS